jgi:hypothetical protein
VARETFGVRTADAEQRAASADIARAVLGRLTQPSAAQAATRLADVILNQRRG